MLEGLERTDRATELLARLGVFHGLLDDRCCRSDLFRGQRDQNDGSDPIDQIFGPLQWPTTNTGERDLRQRSRRIHGGDASAGDALGRWIHFVEPVGRENEQGVCDVSVEDVRRRAGQRVFGCLDAEGAPTRGTCPAQGQRALAGRDTGQQSRACVVVTGKQQCLCGKNRRTQHR